MGKMAIIQNGDTPQLESTADMLRAAGYDDVRYCGPQLRDALKKEGCDTVLGPETMYRMGYDRVHDSIQPADLNDMDRCDLFLEIKVRNIPQILARWPRLHQRIAYLRVNGAQPEICPKGGDEVNLPCPVITACMWYATERYRNGKAGPEDQVAHNLGPSRIVTPEQLRQYAVEANRQLSGGQNDTPCYVCWPPYPRMAEYVGNNRLRITRRIGYDPAYGVAHYMPSWGFGPIVPQVAELGVNLYGDRAPRGQVPHSQIRIIAETAMAFVHLKSVDCPGWALYEAMLSGVPVITARLLNSRMLGYELLEHGETCLEFGVPASLEYGRGEMAYEQCVVDIKAALERLKDPAENERIGQAGKRRLLDLMWSKDKPQDVASFRAFCERHFAK